MIYAIIILQCSALMAMGLLFYEMRLIHSAITLLVEMLEQWYKDDHQ